MDPFVVLRTALLAAVIGFLVGPKIGVTSEVAGAVSWFVGALYDILAYRVKVWLAGMKPEGD